MNIIYESSFIWQIYIFSSIWKMKKNVLMKKVWEWMHVSQLQNMPDVWLFCSFISNRLVGEKQNKLFIHVTLKTNDDLFAQNCWEFQQMLVKLLNSFTKACQADVKAKDLNSLALAKGYWGSRE